MAKAIKEFSKKRFGYKWDNWMNGKVYRAVKGVDFDCSPEGFAATVYSKGWKKNREVTVSVQGNTVEFQFGGQRDGRN